VAGWNSTCSSGQEIHSQATWRDTALAMYPGYTGQRPRIQIYHGSADDLIMPQNWNEAVKQWTGVFGYPEQAVKTDANSPASGYTRYTYGENVQGILGQGVGHSVPVFGEEDLKWFGIIVSFPPSSVYGY
jgi:acetylxylan esterase